MPIRNFKWAILLCKLKNCPVEQHPPQFFKNFVSKKGGGSLTDYWNSMSFGNLDMSDSDIYGWIQLDISAEDMKKLDRSVKIQKCIDAVTSTLPFYEVPEFAFHDGFIAIINAPVDSGRSGNGILWDPPVWNLTFLAHEVGHVLGFDHSFDTNFVSYDLNSESRPGAYGDSRDIMSAQTFAGLQGAFDGVFGDTGPGLNALTRYKLGWLPSDKAWNTSHSVGQPTWQTQIEVAAIDQPAIRRSQLLQISGLGSDGGIVPITYTVEFRPSSGWDAGLPSDAVVIHKVQDGDLPRVLWSPNDTQDWHKGDRLLDIAREIAIDVVFIDSQRGVASVFVQAGPVAAASISVRRSLAHKCDLSKGLRAVKPLSPPFPADSLRSRLLANPPQLSS